MGGLLTRAVFRLEMWHARECLFIGDGKIPSQKVKGANERINVEYIFKYNVRTLKNMVETVAIAKATSYDEEELKESLNNLFSLMGLNPDNPFKEIITPGMTVFIKPNFVASKWRESCSKNGDIYSVITHPALIMGVADYVAIALDGKGKIIIGDNPSIDADFDELMELTQIGKMRNRYDVPCEIIDMRPLVCKELKDYGVKDKMTPQRGDPKGCVTVNLGNNSQFYGIDSSLFRGVFDERDETIASHTGDTQLYSYGKSLFDADVYISIPKMKTHQKAGVTLNLKGLVGSNTNKNQLVHWRIGYPEMGGDEYPSEKDWIESKNIKVTHRGAWPGNDTIWRMVVDLYNGLLTQRRKYITIVDGIYAGEGRGPFCPDLKKAGVIIGGTNLLVTDIVTTRLMGINPMKIRHLDYYIKGDWNYYDNILVMSDCIETDNFFTRDDSYLNFKVNDNWSDVKYNSQDVKQDKKYKIGYTAGVYDLFHIGHLNLLKKAKKMCDYLIVGVTTDELVSYKHKKAVIPFSERASIVQSIEYVDKVVPQTSMNKMDACRQYKFDVMFVGDDWKGTDKWKKYEEEFKSIGVDIIYFPYTIGTSSTLLNETLLKIRGEHNDSR